MSDNTKIEDTNPVPVPSDQLKRDTEKHRFYEEAEKRRADEARAIETQGAEDKAASSNKARAEKENPKNENPKSEKTEKPVTSNQEEPVATKPSKQNKPENDSSPVVTKQGEGAEDTNAGKEDSGKDKKWWEKIFEAIGSLIKWAIDAVSGLFSKKEEVTEIVSASITTSGGKNYSKAAGDELSLLSSLPSPATPVVAKGRQEAAGHSI
ncbi:MAG: hypothetical protein R3D71_07060 [Rickettsiales bacterium]